MDNNLWSLPLDANSATVTGPLRRVTRGTGLVGYPSLSSDGRTMVYSSERAGDWDVYVKAAPDAHEMVIAGGSERQMYSVLSPDGARVAFGIVTSNEEVTRPAFVATLATGENGVPVRISTTLAPKQRVTFSVPGEVDDADVAMELVRDGETPWCIGWESGHADGWPRAAAKGARVRIGGALYPVEDLISGNCRNNIALFKVKADVLPTVDLSPGYMPKQGENIAVITMADGPSVTEGRIQAVAGSKGFFQVSVPVTVTMRWIDDTPMIMLNDLSIPALGTFSARVFFHGNRYSGTWQHGSVGGYMYGRIEH